MGIEYEQIPVHDEATYPVKPQKTKSVSSAPPRRRSPCVKILLVLLIVFVVVPLVLLTLTGIAGYSFLASKVKSITVTEPRRYPIVDYPEAELELVLDRVNLFFDELTAGHVPEQDLILTADQVNGLIAQSDYLAGNAFVRMEENKLTMDMSLSTDGIPGGRRRYLVATAVAKMSGDTLAMDMDAPIDAFDGKLLAGLIQFSMDDENVHHVATLLYGKAFGMEPCDEFYKDGKNRFVMVDDDEDDDDDFLRVLNAIETIALENEQIVFKARQTPKAATTEYTPLSPWNLLRRLF